MLTEVKKNIKCRMCDKPLAPDPLINKDVFYVRDRKGWYAKEWECRDCYTNRVVGPMTNRDSYRDKTGKKKAFATGEEDEESNKPSGYQGSFN